MDNGNSIAEAPSVGDIARGELLRRTATTLPLQVIIDELARRVVAGNAITHEVVE